MALAHTVSNVLWGGLSTVNILSGVAQSSDTIDVLGTAVAGVAIGLSLQIDCLSSAHIRADLIEVLSSVDGTTWDTYGYASNQISITSAAIQHATVTIPLAYAEVLRYLKVKITPATVVGSSFTYTVTCNKVTV